MLTRYIKDLLFREERIVIPNFGTIRTEQVSATIDEVRSVFYPPGKKLIFDTEFSENDGLLAQYIASVDKISHESALNFIKFEVNNWLDKLENEDLILPELGTFSKDINNRIYFEPDPKSNFLTSSFGLENVNSQEVIRSKDDGKTIHLTDEYVIEVAQLKSPEAFKRKRKKTSTTSLLSYFAIFAVLLSVGWLLMREILKNNLLVKNVNEMKASQDAYIDQHLQDAVFELQTPLKALTLKVKVSNIDSLSINYNEKDSLNLNSKSDIPTTTTTVDVKKTNDNLPVNTTKPSVTTKETEKTITNQSEVTATESDNKTYYVIAGSFKGAANAIDKIKELRAKGYNKAVILDRSRDVHQVSYGVYDTEEEALKVLNEVKSETPDAWIKEK